MTRFLLALGLVLLLISPSPAPPVPKGAKFTYLSFKDKGNQAFNDAFHVGNETNTLKDFPRGEQKFDEITFTIGDQCLQLGSTIVQQFPNKIEGIPADLKCDKLHILQATGYGGGPNDEGSPGHCKDGTDIGEYIVNYEDGTSAKIPIVYGKDVRDWFFVQDEKDPERAKVVWKGENEFSKGYKAKLRVYLTTWTNVNPNKKIETIDFIGFGDKTPCAPFCLGITAEGK